MSSSLPASLGLSVKVGLWTWSSDLIVRVVDSRRGCGGCIEVVVGVGAGWSKKGETVGWVIGVRLGVEF